MGIAEMFEKNERDTSNKAAGIPLLTKTFPLGSAGVYPFEEIYIRPMNFNGFVSYIRNYPENADKYTNFLYIYNTASRHITHLDSLYLPDIYYVMYLFWGLSINENIEVTISDACMSCGNVSQHKIGMADISFRSFDTPIFELELSGKKYQCKFPTGNKIREHIPKIIATKKSQIFDFDIALLVISFIEYERNGFEIENLVANATHDDILVLLSALSQYILPPANEYVYKCSKCGATNSIDYYSRLPRDFFRIFIENRRLT